MKERLPMKPEARMALVVQKGSDSARTVSLLHELNWKAVEVWTWREAEQQFAQGRFEVMISDYHVAGGNGFDLIVDWWQRESYWRVLFIAKGPIASIIPIEEMGMSGLLVKPFGLDELKTALDRVMSLEFRVDQDFD